ncbi:MAG TPA: hypothetical protein VKC89_02765 [Patescibacteria group bacterium]|nr:hypothetical protein [Patescibacteria group bacterium]
MAGIENRITCVRVDILKDGTATVSDILGDEQFAVDSQTDMATVRVSGPIDSQTDMAIVRSRTLKVPFSRFNHALNEEVFEAKAVKAGNSSYFALKRTKRGF